MDSTESNVSFSCLIDDSYPDLMWRSKNANPINKWYFERCKSNQSLDSTWRMFWYGPLGMKRLRSYEHVARSIPPSFQERQEQ